MNLIYSLHPCAAQLAIPLTPLTLVISLLSSCPVVLLLAYKNHALDEFLIDVVNSSHSIGRVGKLIRVGKPERLEELQKYTEK
jgi:hypothetical protein